MEAGHSGRIGAHAQSHAILAFKADRDCVISLSQKMVVFHVLDQMRRADLARKGLVKVSHQILLK